MGILGGDDNYENGRTRVKRLSVQISVLLQTLEDCFCN